MATTTRSGNIQDPNFGKQQENAGDTAKQFGDKAKDMASNVASTVAGKARDAASSVGQRAEDATHAVGGSLQSLAGTIRENAPQSGMLGTVGSSVASGLETGGRYLKEEGLSGIADDMTNMIRRNPLPALLVAVGLGFILARATSRS
jgi:hypothetical protein